MHTSFSESVYFMRISCGFSEDNEIYTEDFNEIHICLSDLKSVLPHFCKYCTNCGSDLIEVTHLRLLCQILLSK